jgi:hypothetical protein
MWRQYIAFVPTYQHAWCIGTYIDGVEDHVMNPNVHAATEFRGLVPNSGQYLGLTGGHRLLACQ